MTAIASPPPSLARTPLSDWHTAHGGRLVDFAGWLMPVQYGSIIEEHTATRTATGLFDVSHMGRLAIRGPGAGAFLDHVLTRRVSGLKPGQIRYALVCNETGGVLDDILAGRDAPSARNPSPRNPTPENFSMVVNASNRAKIIDWLTQHKDPYEIDLIDSTEATAMIAVQGPRARALLQSLTELDLASMRYYTTTGSTLAGVRCAISRTGYTGEDGCELICAADEAAGLWEKLIASGGKPCGLAARDTLRLEAGMPLYGHELNEETNPLQAGLRFAVTFKTPDGTPRPFIGSEALIKAGDCPTNPVRVGLIVDGKRPPREAYRVLAEGNAIGWISSGTHSPTLGKPIAMAYVAPQFAEEGTPLTVDIRGKEAAAVVVPLPFYRKA